MQLQTILNKVQKFKGYVYENVTMSQDGKKLDVEVRPRRGPAPRVQTAAGMTQCMIILRKLGDSSSCRCGKSRCSLSRDAACRLPPLPANRRGAGSVG